MLKLLVGPMKAEKTGELIRLVKRASIGNKNIVVLSPQIDERTVGEVIESRNGSKVKAFRVQSSELIESYINEPVDIVFIDEIHMWDEGLVREVCKLTDLGIDVVCSGHGYGVGKEEGSDCGGESEAKASREAGRGGACI